MRISDRHHYEEEKEEDADECDDDYGTIGKPLRKPQYSGPSLKASSPLPSQPPSPRAAQAGPCALNSWLP